MWLIVIAFDEAVKRKTMTYFGTRQRLQGRLASSGQPNYKITQELGVDANKVTPTRQSLAKPFDTLHQD